MSKATTAKPKPSVKKLTTAKPKPAVKKPRKIYGRGFQSYESDGITKNFEEENELIDTILKMFKTYNENINKNVYKANKDHKFPDKYYQDTKTLTKLITDFKKKHGFDLTLEVNHLDKNSSYDDIERGITDILQDYITRGGNKLYEFIIKYNDIKISPKIHKFNIPSSAGILKLFEKYDLIDTILKMFETYNENITKEGIYQEDRELTTKFYNDTSTLTTLINILHVDKLDENSEYNIIEDSIIKIIQDYISEGGNKYMELINKYERIKISLTKHKFNVHVYEPYVRISHFPRAEFNTRRFH
jgi:hypothetical protein